MVHGLHVCAMLFVSYSAGADPRTFPLVTRNLASVAQAARCESTAEFFFCQTLSANDAHDHRGQNVNAAVFIVEEGSDFVAGTQVFRTLGCTVSRDALVTSRTGATLEATLDTASSSCFSDGFRCDSSAVCEPYAFSGVIAVRGDWQQPIGTVTGQGQQKRANSATGESLSLECHEAGGELMQAGGFGVGDEFTPFDGRSEPQVGDSFLYGEFLHQSCNNKTR
jgi:hypothetical protein